VRRPNEIWLQPGEEPPAQPETDEALSQEELLRQPVYIPHRPLKDPREIRMLDPACGSMHFGLYAFDLYLEIYKEAWEIAQGSDEQSKQEEAFSSFVAYTACFADKAAFLREVPRLILQHNIHGIDIDPRASQIAKLTLWLRSQREWQHQRLAVADRPPITRANVVCAEPMPGEKVLLREFIELHFDANEQKVFGFLLEAVFDYMLAAGELGSLLQVEKMISSLISEARRLWRSGPQYDQPELFPNSITATEQGTLGLDVSGITDQEFWNQAEQRVYTALEAYAVQAIGSTKLQRTLFANDTTQGFAFIDICRSRYDAYLMNPPFGASPVSQKQYLNTRYSRSANELYAAFVERAALLLCKNGKIGAITSRQAFFLSTFQRWREEVLFGDMSISLMADLGYGVLDSAMVETAAYCAARDDLASSFFVQLNKFDVDHKQDELLRSTANMCHRVCTASNGIVFIQRKAFFRQIPSTPLAYWASTRVGDIYRNMPSFASDDRKAIFGASTKDNFRFCRASWEIPSSLRGYSREDTFHRKPWVPFAKGGSYSPYYQDVPLVLNWGRDGYALKCLISQYRASKGCGYQWSASLNGHSHYFSSCLTYGRRVRKFSPQLFANGIFSDSSCAIIVKDIPLYLGILNSTTIRYFLSLQTTARKMEVGHLQNIPVPSNVENSPFSDRIRKLVDESYLLAKRIKSVKETSDFFYLPLLLQVESTSFGTLLDEAFRAFDAMRTRLQNLQDEIDECVLGLYDLSASEIGNSSVDIAEPDESDSVGSDSEYQEESLSDRDEFNRLHIFSLISFCLGMQFGVFDVSERRNVFAGCYQGLQQELDSQPLRSPLSSIPEATTRDSDSMSRVGVIAFENSSANGGAVLHNEMLKKALQFSVPDHAVDEAIGQLWSKVGCRSADDFFSKPSVFFEYHLSLHSFGRVAAPLYWQISAGGGGYCIWLYYLRLTADSVYLVLRDFVDPRIQQADRDRLELQSQSGLSDKESARLQQTQLLLEELHLFKSELALVAPLWRPNLNDGVIINHAILWRITPYTPWQKKCKECWDKLVKGDYDWAHLAFHLWPERVIPRCTTDRSLAIAHGLEERLWQETNNGNWLPRQLSEADLQALIAEHSNPAVKSALERFLAAPPPVAPTRTRASRSTPASASSAPRRARGSAAVVDAEATRQVLLALTAAPSDGLAKTQIADLIGVEANALTAVIKQLKESGQIDQLGERRGARYVLSEQGRAAVASQAGEGD
jgi:hypothetical protein